MAFKHIGEHKFSDKQVGSKNDTPRVSDADSDEFKHDLRTFSFDLINKVSEPLKKIDMLLEFNNKFKGGISLQLANKE